MTDSPATNADTSTEEEVVDLRNPLLAAGLALLWPGLGHIYQRRYHKGILFMVCILLTFVFGWSLGGGKVVYAQWRDNTSILEQRWHYACQVWVGLPAWPALAQSLESRPFGKTFMAPPINHEEEAQWQREHHGLFELGTIFTTIAGLLNLLVIFDAAGGPLGSAPVVEKDDKKKSSADAADKETSKQPT